MKKKERDEENNITQPAATTELDASGLSNRSLAPDEV